MMVVNKAIDTITLKQCQETIHVHRIARLNPDRPELEAAE